MLCFNSHNFELEWLGNWRETKGEFTFSLPSMIVCELEATISMLCVYRSGIILM